MSVNHPFRQSQNTATCEVALQTQLPKSGTTSVVLYDASRQQDWHTFVNTSPLTVFAHHLGWKSVVEETFGHQAIYLMAYCQERLVGILPLFLVRSMLFGRFLVTSPFLTFGGIACEDADATKALIARAMQIARDYCVDYVEVRNEKPCEFLPYTKTQYYTLMLDLTSGEDEIWHSLLRPTARRNVRKALKAGLKLVEGQRYLDAFADINASNMHRLGTPAHSPSFFYNIMKYFPQSTLLMLRSGHTFIGGMLLVRFKEMLLMPWVASLPEYFHMRPNNLLYWEAIARACRDGLRNFDFGRSKWDSGTFRFKRQFGAQPVPLYYQYYLHQAHQVPDVDPDTTTFMPLMTLWRKLPISLVKVLGPRIIRWIP